MGATRKKNKRQKSDGDFGLSGFKLVRSNSLADKIDSG